MSVVREPRKMFETITAKPEISLAPRLAPSGGSLGSKSMPKYQIPASTIAKWANTSIAAMR